MAAGDPLDLRCLIALPKEVPIFTGYFPSFGIQELELAIAVTKNTGIWMMQAEQPTASTIISAPSRKAL